MAWFRARGLPPNGLILSFSEDGAVEKLEFRIRGAVPYELALDAILQFIDSATAVSLKQRLASCQLTINVVSLRLSPSGVVDAGVYGTPRLH